MSRITRKPDFGVSDQDVQPQRMVRGLEFRIYKKRDGPISCAITMQRICAFVFAYTKRRFSHDAALLKSQSMYEDGATYFDT